MISPQRIVCVCFAILALTAKTRADVVNLVSNRDTTIYQDNPNNSDGAGQAMFVGNTGVPGACRGLVGFDIAGNIPAGSTINAVQLSLVLGLTAAGDTTARKIELHRLVANWGEGNAGQGSGGLHGGQGFLTAANGTAATWTSAFFNTMPWTHTGGDFAATASGSAMVGTTVNTAYVWDTTPGMVGDVQSWLDNPSSNFGWLLLGDETARATVRVFNTREAQDHGVWPSLVVTFTPPRPITPHLVVTAPSSVTAGSVFDVTVTAEDNSGQVVPGYTGTVTFSTSDSYPGVLPDSYTFTANDQGTHTFSGGVTLFTAGAQTLTVQDTADSSIVGSGTVAVVAAPADHLQVTSSATAISGVPFDVTVAALDPFGNVDMSYEGTITWTSSDTDPGVLVPADYTFQTADGGMHIFSGGATLVTLGDQTLAATDTVSGITGSATITVGGGP